MVKGKAVYGYNLLFLANWISNFARHATLDYAYYAPETFIDEAGGFPVSDGFVQPYGDLPYADNAVGESVYLQIIGRAKRYVYISKQ
jgi:cardiolipin synthase